LFSGIGDSKPKESDDDDSDESDDEKEKKPTLAIESGAPGVSSAPSNAPPTGDLFSLLDLDSSVPATQPA